MSAPASTAMSARHVTIHRLVAQATLAGTCVVLASCASAPLTDPGAIRVRSELSELQGDPRLASQSPVALKAAESAVREAEIASRDEALVRHRVYVAERRLHTAKALAEAQYAVSQRKALADQSDQMRLDARTGEADRATRAARLARGDADSARLAAEQARAEAGAAQSRNDALVAELADLNARKTERGVQLTLGDVLFSSGRAELAAGSAANLDKLVAALGKSPERRLLIDGYTDSQGSDAMNQQLSQRRADAVSGYLSSRGVAASRITATGRGETLPVAGNEIAAGRQLNRRVEVTIQDPQP